MPATDRKSCLNKEELSTTPKIALRVRITVRGTLSSTVLRFIIAVRLSLLPRPYEHRELSRYCSIRVIGT